MAGYVSQDDDFCKAWDATKGDVYKTKTRLENGG